MTPHFTSAIAAFGVVLFVYGSIVASEMWFLYRKHLVEGSRKLKSQLNKSLGEKIRYGVYTVLTLGVFDLSEPALRQDEKAIKILAGAGVPIACFLHGYAGFIFGSVKANALWMTPLMPVIFIMSAIVSGVALCLLTYIMTMEIRKFKVSRKRASFVYPTFEEIKGVEMLEVKMTPKIPPPFSYLLHKPRIIGPGLPGLYGGEILGYPQVSYLWKGLHQYLHSSIYSRKPCPLHPPADARAYDPKGHPGPRSGHFRGLHDEVERGHRRAIFFPYLFWIHGLCPSYHPARFRYF